MPPSNEHALSYEENGRNVFVADKQGRAIRYDYAGAHEAYAELRDGVTELRIVDYSDVPEKLRQRVKAGG